MEGLRDLPNYDRDTQWRSSSARRSKTFAEDWKKFWWHAPSSAFSRVNARKDFVCGSCKLSPFFQCFFWISFLYGTDFPRVVQGVYWLEGKDDFVTILCRLKLENSVVAMFEKFNSREKRKCPRLFVNGLRKNSKNWYPPFSKMKGAIRKSIAILIVTCYVLRLIFSGHLLESSANTLYTKTPPNFHWFLQVVIIHNLFLITGYPWVKFGEKFCVSFLLRLFVCLFVERCPIP